MTLASVISAVGIPAFVGLVFMVGKVSVICLARLFVGKTGPHGAGESLAEVGVELSFLGLAFLVETLLDGGHILAGDASRLGMPLVLLCPFISVLMFVGFVSGRWPMPTVTASWLFGFLTVGFGRHLG